MLKHEKVTHEIIGAAMEVHKVLGPGLLESAYAACLSHELVLRGLSVEREVALPVVYKECRVDCGYRMDLVVGGCVVVEVKAVEKTLPIHEAQLLSYLRLSGRSVGLMINFHIKRLTEGITRRVV